MTLNKCIAIFLSSFFIIGLTSCTAASKIGQVLMDPSIPVGKLEERPSILSLSFLSENNINENDENLASPIQVQIVYLTEDSRLLDSYYEQLIEEKLEDILGKNYLDHQDYTIIPNQYKVVPNIILGEKNRYLGVIAYYSDPEKAQWRKVIKLEGLGHNYHVLVHLRKFEVEIKEYE